MVLGIFAVACHCLTSGILTSGARTVSTTESKQCHRVDNDGTCKAISSDNCGLPEFRTSEGTCADAGYPYCALGMYSIQIWANGKDESCKIALHAITNAGFSNDGCGGAGKALPCGPPAPAAHTSHPTKPLPEVPSQCHSVDAEDQCFEESPSAELGCTGQTKAGSCSESGFAYCSLGLYGHQIWQNKKGAEHACTLQIHRVYDNDGCGGLGLPLPCKETIAEAVCHRVDNDGTCKAISSNDCGLPEFRTSEGTCADAGYPYCALGMYSIQIWANGKDESCKIALHAMTNAGFSNDGCGGAGKALPCGPPTPSAM